MRITFRKHANKTGLARVCQGPRGYDAKINGVVVASIYPLSVGFHEYRGWYWACAKNESLGIEHRNTYATPTNTADEAKAQCKAYLLACVKELP